METQELSLFVECHEFLCSVDTRAIERLVLPEDVVVLSSKEGSIPVVQVGGRPYAFFNLGVLLGLPPTRGASVLIRTVFGGAELPLCFETGTCLVVRSPEPATMFVPGLFKARRRAFASAFTVPPTMRRAGRALVGLSLDIGELASAKERESAASALRAIAPRAAAVGGAP